MNKNESSFSYTYFANQQAEVENIRKKYLPQEESSFEKLKRLDKKAGRKGSIVCISLGIISCLLLGIGVCFTMLWTDWFVQGIVIGLTGIAGAVLMYPLYVRITRREKEKLAPQILELTDELLNNK